MSRELTDSDYKCPDCGCRMDFKDCKEAGSGWIYILMCPIHKREVPIFKSN